MAQIKSTVSEKVFPIKTWLGLNECEDGDTKLKIGEATVMRNWRITDDGNLKQRPGQVLVRGLCLAYEAVDAEEASVVYTGDGTDEFQIYSGVTASSMDASAGEVSISESLGTFTVAEISERDLTTPVYFKPSADPYNNYRISECSVTDGVYTIKGLKQIAKSTLNTNNEVRGMWSGYVGGTEMLLAVCNNRLWRLDFTSTSRTNCGPIDCSEGTAHFFPFSGIVYILTGTKYYQYDGTELKEVEGYRPLVGIAIAPNTAWGGEYYEYINLLCGQRRVWISPDGEGSVFQLPETNISSIDWIKNLKTGEEVPEGTATFDRTTGTVTFATAPEQSVNSYEIAYSVANPLRSQVERMRFSELYSGTQDTRVFLYGDGSNVAIYSGLDYNGTPRADYFPDQCSVRVGDENTPITSMIRHYSALIAYKTNSAWSITFGITTLADSSLTPAFYTVPVNRDIGNMAPGQVTLVNSNPVTFFGNDLYEWRNSSYYNSNLTSDERQARRVSERISATLRTFDPAEMVIWDDNLRQECYFHYDGTTIVWNYKANAWYIYEGLDISCMCNFQGVRMIGTSDGFLINLNDLETTDRGEKINCYWESGAMDFGQDYMRKYAAMLWLGLQPEDGTAINVTVRTDRKETFNEKVVSSTKAKVDGEPFMSRTKLKAKKFVYYTLILKTDAEYQTATVTAVDVRVRFTGYAKG